MFRTSQNELQQFSNMIKKHIFIECDNNGRWKQETTCHRINQMLKCHHHENDRLVAIGKAFSSLIDNLEKTPILFEVDEKITNAQKVNFQTHLELADLVIAELEKGTSKEVEAQLAIVTTRMIGL